MNGKQVRKKQLVLKFLKESFGNVTYSCDRAAISRRSYYNWYNDDEDFKQKCDEIADMSVDLAESKLLQSINDGNLTAIIFYLKTKGKDRGYVERIENDVSVSPFLEAMRNLPDNPEDLSKE